MFLFLVVFCIVSENPVVFLPKECEGWTCRYSLRFLALCLKYIRTFAFWVIRFFSSDNLENTDTYQIHTNPSHLIVFKNLNKILVIISSRKSECWHFKVFLLCMYNLYRNYLYVYLLIQRAGTHITKQTMINNAANTRTVW